MDGTDGKKHGKGMQGNEWKRREGVKCKECKGWNVLGKEKGWKEIDGKRRKKGTDKKGMEGNGRKGAIGIL